MEICGQKIDLDNLESVYLNCDCMQGMREFPDKYFDLAIVDVPYGIGESGGKNHTRGNIAMAKDYKPFEGNGLKARRSKCLSHTDVKIAFMESIYPKIVVMIVL